jgi:hypothetical protein
VVTPVEKKPAVRVEIKTPVVPKAVVTPPKPVVEAVQPPKKKTPLNLVSESIVSDLKKRGVTKATASKFTQVILSAIKEHTKKSNFKGDPNDVIHEVVTLLSK